MKTLHVLYISILSLFYILFFTACNTTKHVPDKQYLLNSNKIQTDENKLDTKPIYNYLKQHDNTKTALLFNFHLWIYNIANDKAGKKEQKLKKWLGIYKLGNIIGEPPVIIDSTLTQASVKQIHRYLQNKGYYYADIKDSIHVFGSKKKKANIYYLIKTGQAFRINTIKYNIPDTNILNLMLTDTSHSPIKHNTRLDADLMQKERVRITKFLKNNGYYKFAKEFIYYQVDTNASKFTADVEIKIINPQDNIHQQYTLKNIYYFFGFQPQEYLKQKETYYQLFDTTSYKEDFFLFQKPPFVKPKVIYNSSYLKKGELYSASNVQLTIRRLSSLNEFNLINIRYNEKPDTNLIDVLVQLTPFKKHNYVTEIEGTNSSGNLGIGGRLSYQHKSLFKGAELFNISLYGKLESQKTFSNSSENIAFNSQEIGAYMNLHFPQFLLPFRSEQFIKKNHPRTVLEVNINYKDRPEYTRSIYGSSFGYYWNSTRFFKHQFKAIDISAVKVFNMDPEYYESIQNTYLEKSFDDYLISASNYTLFFTNKKEKKERNYISIIFNGEVAGNLLNLYSTLRKSETIDGSYYIFNNIFAQYWRTEFNFIYNQSLKKKNKLVYRLYGGMAHPYGNITAMPYVKQFFSGGANGLRAWPIRSLGPGSYYNSDRKYYNEAADLKLEGNMEYRFKLFWVVEGAWFLDAGNIWATSKQDPREGALFSFDNFYKEIAIGTGVGIRLDFNFFIFRIDYGIRVRDPKEIENNRWIIFNNQYNPFNSDYSMLNFGINYPF